ncbi:hypothetical protein DSM106972_024390 [Dulcicalothrix desertica PCC 7102]|uniref:Glycosyl transferase n=1 Tax=Dulcicalothrix desertica PCC 7102 TaxID=232991 RepID=A0A433VM28_9CYAN|nr:hypothetical protein [Dulcicalothrix desertica]RUT07178.1 hypothetical protein DSM106972_024390 [Dulcicalothrix desertica PCC 7102]TWH61827.1 hypothetical protein CAL7102_00504 [Dulcicalothrix desertica PCC 7102]
MKANSGVTLQINLAPSDLLYARYTLPHQLRQFAHQVDEILLTLDLHRSSGRFAEGWQERLPKIKDLINECCNKYPHAHLKEVDYSPTAIKNVSSMFFGKSIIPAKDFRGGPFYSYFFGLYTAKNNYIFHLDSDLMFGGGSSTWIAEAVQLLSEKPDVLVCGPLPGPPTSDGSLRSQVAEPELHYSPAFRFSSLSTRYFLLDRERFQSKIKQLPLKYASPRSIIKALVEGNYPYQLPEEVISLAMEEHSLARVEFLGQAPGMWSLHPPYRCQNFYESLPKLIQAVESEDIPEAQRGDHDVNDSLVDWSSARAALKQNRWWKRLRNKWKNKLLNNLLSN